MKKYDFSGYATKNDLKCTDGRVIRKDAFKDSNGVTVPLVWQHLHNEPSNVLGHAVLENRDDGVYAYGVFNETAAGRDAKKLVENGDITRLSIYANDLVEKSKNVLHGVIREVSLVMAGANPGAVIDNIVIAHADGSDVEAEDEAVIYTGELISLPEKEAQHADASSSDDGETVGDVFNSLSEKQKTAVYALIAEILDSSSEEDVTHSDEDDDEEGENTVKHNVFDSKDETARKNVLSHSQIETIFNDAKRLGSLKESVLMHVVEYGIENIDYLFPDAQTVTNRPEMIARRMEWVSGVINGTKHTPFSRIKSLAADITADAARALGYVKGNLKKEEVISLLRRTTEPTTIYKKQKLDRDDIIDITDLDVVAWLKAEMRVMLDEELARAILVGDGRDLEVGGNPNPDKIDETKIRPIYNDDDMYAHKLVVAYDDTGEEIIDAMINARENYKGSGNPAFYTTTAFLNKLLLLRDLEGRRLYRTQTELETELRVSKIVEVEVLTGVTYDVTLPAPATLDLLGIFVNLSDYVLGADKGGQVSMFDDFDIDYNQYKYLMETRCSGALVKPKSALVVFSTQRPGG